MHFYEHIQLSNFKPVCISIKKLTSNTGMSVIFVLIILTVTISRSFYSLWFMVFHATFNSISAISWHSVLLVEETGVPGKNHQPVASY